MARTTAMRITRLALDNWRNFKTVDVDLERRVFLVGPNAAGKSNMLDAMRFLHDLVRVGGGLQAAVEERGGVSKIRALSARAKSDICIEIDMDVDDAAEGVPAMWSYKVQFSQNPQRQPRIKAERVLHHGDVLVSRPDDEDTQDPERQTQTFLEQVQSNHAFRDIATFLQTIRYQHIVPQLVREPDRSVGRRQDPFGGDFLEQLATTPSRTLKARLRRIEAALRIAVPQLQEIQLDRDERGMPHLRGRYEHWRRHGAWQDEDQFSDGTLRLFGFLWAVLDGRGPLRLEEPELSLHPEIVRHLAQILHRAQKSSGRQLLVSTHSPDLLRDEGIGLDEVLILQPGDEGTQVTLATNHDDIRLLLDGGLSMADAVMPKTQPLNAKQLLLFGS